MFSLHLLTPRTVNTVTNSYDTSAVLPQIVLAEVRQQTHSRFEVCTVLLRFFLCRSSCSDFWVEEDCKQMYRQRLILCYEQILLMFLLFLSYPNIHTYIFLFNCTIITQNARKRIVLIWEEM